MDRRTFTLYSPAALTIFAQQWADLEPERLTSALGGSRLDENTLAALETSTSRLTGLATAQRQHITQALTGHLKDINGLLANSPCDQDAERRLHRMAASVAVCLGWHRFDQGLHGDAAHYWHGALHSAHAAADRDLGAGIISDQSYQMLWQGAPKAAAGHLAPALNRAVHPTARALLHLRRARALAQLGDERACTRDLHAAEAAYAAGATRGTPPDWCAWMSPADLAVDTGRCMLDLGHVGEAHVHITDGIGQLPAARAKTKAIFGLYHASSLLVAGEVEQAATVTLQSHTIVSELGADRCARLVQDLAEEFTPHRNVAGVPELLEVVQAA